jgi:GAF domain-containing protein
MANTLYPPSQPLSIGEVLDLSFRIFRVSLLKCLPLAVAGLLGGQLPTIYSIASGQPLAGLLAPRHNGTWWTLYVIGVLLSLTLWAAVLIRQHAIVRDQSMSAIEALRLGLRRMPGLLVITIMLFLCIGLWFVPVGALGVGHAGAAVLAALLLLIPASWVALRLSCASTAYLVTVRGPFDCLGYSWRLTDGSFWRLAAIYTVVLFILIAFYFLAGMIAAAIAVPLGLGDVALVTAVTASLVIIFGAAVTPFFTAVALAVFGDLTVRREGSDLAAKLSNPATP